MGQHVIRLSLIDAIVTGVGRSFIRPGERGHQRRLVTECTAMQPRNACGREARRNPLPRGAMGSTRCGANGPVHEQPHFPSNPRRLLWNYGVTYASHDVYRSEKGDVVLAA